MWHKSLRLIDCKEYRKEVTRSNASKKDTRIEGEVIC